MASTPDVVLQVTTALANYLSTDPDSLGFGFQNVLPEWPGAETTLNYPAVAILAPEEMVEEPHPPFPVDDAVGVSAGAICMKYGEATGTWTLEIFCNSKPQRRQIRNALMQAFARDTRKPGIYLSMASYWSEVASFLPKRWQQIGDEKDAKTSDWRLHVELEVECSLLREYSGPNVTSAPLSPTLQTTVSTSDPTTAPPDEGLLPTV